MDLLKISDEQEGMYLKNDGWVPIRDIERDDLLALCLLYTSDAADD